MNLGCITPVLLTRDEELNIGRTLEKLAWAGDIVVVDSFSRDRTPEILAGFSNVRIFQRTFDSHSAQWNFALRETGIKTEWILALDADYVLTDTLIESIRCLEPSPLQNGFESRFRYCVDGKPLRASLYPPVTVLYRKDRAIYIQDGHTHRVRVDGGVGRLEGLILHDDRKPLGQWFASQGRYAELEAEKLSKTPWRDLSWPDRVRKTKLFAPGLVLFYCLFLKGLILEGTNGLFYGFQRMLAEILISLYLFRRESGGRQK